jgi:hypothetical protein
MQFYLNRKDHICSNVIRLVAKNVQTKNKIQQLFVIQREIINYFDHSRSVKHLHFQNATITCLIGMLNNQLS